MCIENALLSLSLETVLLCSQLLFASIFPRVIPSFDPYTAQNSCDAAAYQRSKR